MNSSSISSSGLDAAEFLARLADDAVSLSVLATTSPLLCVDLSDLEDVGATDTSNLVLPVCPVIGVRPSKQILPEREWPAFVDAVVESDIELAQVRSVVQKCPRAATVFVQLLRHTERLSVAQGLFAESLAYSTLQHGSEFSGWLAQQQSIRVKQGTAAEDASEPAVRVAREAHRLSIVLNRPQRKNAFSVEMRDLLCEALELACVDDSITEVALSGAGSAFCSGGDLQEFGQARDATLAHLSRTTRSAGALLHALQQRVSVTVQGACIGAGIELPAFSHHVQARADSVFALPEVTLGLVPGAGGCISLPRRIGRHRTAFMGLTGTRIDAQKALDWGLVDEVISD